MVAIQCSPISRPCARNPSSLGPLRFGALARWQGLDVFGFRRTNRCCPRGPAHRGLKTAFVLSVPQAAPLLRPLGVDSVHEPGGAKLQEKC